MTELPTGFFFYIMWCNDSLCWEWVYLLSGFKDLIFLLLGAFAGISFLSQSWGASHPHIGGLGGHCETNVLGSEMGPRGDPAFRASFSVRSNNTKQFTNIKHMHRGPTALPLWPRLPAAQLWGKQLPSARGDNGLAVGAQSHLTLEATSGAHPTSRDLPRQQLLDNWASATFTTQMAQ